MDREPDKRQSIERIVEALDGLNSIQVEVLAAIIRRFAEEQVSEFVRSDFLDRNEFDFFSVRLAVHHASSAIPVKKENFEHILEMAFARSGKDAGRSDSMTERGADLRVDDRTYSLKTEAAKGLRPSHITISKLMEAAWIKDVSGTADIPPFIGSSVLPHFANYERVFILRSRPDPERDGHIRYDLHEIPKDLLGLIGELGAGDFSTPTAKRTTGAEVKRCGRTLYRFKLDGSDDKLTITDLDVTLCPLHAWWSMRPPG